MGALNMDKGFAPSGLESGGEEARSETTEGK